MKDSQLAAILAKVRRPGRYIGGELNQIVKGRCGVRMALAFPDAYEVGMSNLGLQILYEIINAQPGVACERAFAPWPDMESEMRRAGLPLFSLESRTPLREFDIIGFSLQYELTFTNVLNMLDMSGIPIFSQGRNAAHPIIIAGGPCVFNPEPMAPFIDAFVIGEGEDVVIEIATCVRAAKEKTGGDRRHRLIKALSKVEGVYVPALQARPKDGSERQAAVPPRIKRRIKKDFDQAALATAPVVPYLETVHDRCVVEVMRGCTRGCRFCQAGIVYRPARERSFKTVTAAVRRQVENSGYEEVSLASLSATDHSDIMTLLEAVGSLAATPAWRVSLPSMRTDRFSVDLATKLAGAKKASLTFAPEAGTERLRQVINKGLCEADVLAAALAAFSSGWSKIKLYFMIGLPTETDEDVMGIATLVNKILSTARDELGPKAAKRLKITVSVSSFIPKAHSPFQWAAMATETEIAGRQALLREALRSRQIDLKWHDIKSSQIEAALAVGGREIAPVIAGAYQLGARFDGWSDCFSPDIWSMAFATAGVDLAQAAHRARSLDEPLPWDHIDCGVPKAWLAKEYERALRGVETADCRSGPCSACGVCQAETRMEIQSVQSDDKDTSKIR